MSSWCIPETFKFHWILYDRDVVFPIKGLLLHLNGHLHSNVLHFRDDTIVVSLRLVVQSLEIVVHICTIKPVDGYLRPPVIYSVCLLTCLAEKWRNDHSGHDDTGFFDLGGGPHNDKNTTYWKTFIHWTASSWAFYRGKYESRGLKIEPTPSLLSKMSLLNDSSSVQGPCLS